MQQTSPEIMIESFKQIFYKKTATQIRNSYLSKLMYHRVWLAPIHQPRSH